jgi:tetratricopeptide (TPR) repeat protein
VKTGDTVDRFTILKKLGHGGMGGVFIGFDPQTDELVAVKILFQEYADDEIYVRRFQREIAILKSLLHPNVVKLVDAGVDKDTHYMALEFVRGKPLSDLIQARKKVPLDVALKLVKDVARALAYAHSNGVVHRDIKPANIMVIERDWIAKILDFGVAFVEDQLLQTSTGRFVGTLSYAAPEQVQGKSADERADLYSMGLVCYEMLTGRKAILGTNQASILQQQLGDAYVPPSQADPTLPPDLNNVILKLLRCDPNQRYQKADQFLYDLELFESRYKSMAFHSRSVYDFPEFVKEFQEANAAFEAKDFDSSLRICQDLARKAPRAAEVFFLLGKIQVDRGFVYNGIREYIKATAFDPDNTYYHLSLGLAYQQIGMLAQAKAEYETALHLDPNSRVVRQRLQELERGGPVQASSKPGLPQSQSGPVAIQNPNSPDSVIETPAEQKEKALEKLRREREPILARLKELRPLAKNPMGAAGKSALWWGWGFQEAGAQKKMLVATAIQLAAVGVAGYLLTHPQFFKTLLGPQIQPGPFDFLRKPENVANLVYMLYALATAYFVNDARHDTYLSGLQGYVVGEKTDRHWITVNLGSDRGIKTNQVLHVFKEQQRGSGKGSLVGRMLVKEYNEDTCTGPYFPDTREAPALGDVAVAQEALRAKLVDPEEPLPGRFPPLVDQEGAPAGAPQLAKEMR